jgi:hypothetical protein
MGAENRSGVRFEGIIDFGTRRPGAVLAVVLAVHFIVWSFLPIVLQNNLELDLVEDLALGKEWQLGYWKHPPLSWWTADAAYRIAGDIRVVYFLGPFSAVVCMYFVWRLAREVLPQQAALIAVLTLEGIHFFNYSVMKFGADQIQLPFWAATGWFFYHAFARGRAIDWAMSGTGLALAFWSKYAAFTLAGTMGVVLFADPDARRSWLTPGPYIMGVAFLILIAPQAWWLVANKFQPFQYLDARAVAATHWYQYIEFPLRWILSQVFFLLPAIVLLGALLIGTFPRRQPNSPDEDFARRYVTAMAFGPFLLTTLAALALGRMPVALWGYPFWSFAPLAAIKWWGHEWERRRLFHFAAAFLFVFTVTPIVYALDDLFEPFVRDRPRAREFSGRMMADIISRDWRQKTGKPVPYVGGTEFAANNVSVYSQDRPHVVPHGEPKLSPWITRDDLRRKGIVLVWERNLAPNMPENMRANFPEAEFQANLDVPRYTWRKRPPVSVGYAFVWPKL